jgi:hypothetical protein
MSRTFVEDVSGRDDDAAPKTPVAAGRPEQKSWTIMLERKVKAHLGNDQISVEKLQLDTNGQWVIVVNGNIIIHRPGKTVTSIYRLSNIDGPANVENIRTAHYKNLVNASKPSARVPNESTLWALLVDNLRQDIPNVKLACLEPVTAETKKDDPVADFFAKDDTAKAPAKSKRAIKRRGDEPAVADPKSEMPAYQRESLEAGKAKPRDVLTEGFEPLLPLMENVEAFINHDCLLIPGVDVEGRDVSFAVNVYLPIEELVNNEFQVVEHLHLFTVVDEHTYSLSPTKLPRNDEGLQTIHIDFADMKSGRVVQLMAEFFGQFQMRESFVYSDGVNLALPQEYVGQQMFVLAIMAMAKAPVRRHSVKVFQTCKHPMPAVVSAIQETRLKTVYTAPLLEPKGD